MKRNDPREPEHRLGGNVYTATYLEALIESWTERRKEPPGPSLVDTVRQGIRDALRRNTERDGDSMAASGERVGGSGKGTHADPTFAASQRRRDYDEVDALVGDIVGHVLEADTHLRAASSRFYRLLQLSADEERVNSLGTCECCGESALRIRSGYCPACYQAWLRDGRSERFGFERRRRAYLDAKGSGVRGEPCAL